MKEHGNSYLNVVAARAAKEHFWTRKKLYLLLCDLDIFHSVPNAEIPLENRHILACFQAEMHRLFVEYYRSRSIFRVYYGMGFELVKRRLENLGYATNQFRIQNLEYHEIFPKKMEVK